MMEVTMRPVCFAFGVLAFGAFTMAGQELPDAPGKAETEKLCKQCHEMSRSISKRQDKEGWVNTLTKMSAFGMKSTDKEFAIVAEYLTKHYPADNVERVNVNTATAIQLESGLSLRRSQAAALIAYRKEHGNFKSLDDLKKVPQLESAKLDEKKDRITF
jgi:competence protein ComEA